MKDIVKILGKVFWIIMIAVFLFGIQSCYAKKHHKAVPCPCEKRKKR